MPSKKSQSNGSKAEVAADAQSTSSAQTSDPKDANPTKNDISEKTESTDGPPKKRKAQQPNETNKIPRRSARGTPASKKDPIKILQFLLSSSSLDLCCPKDEFEDLKTRGANTRTYSSSTFTPFEELICALILSRPISHTLGLRSIRTLFNAPYELTTPKKIREAGNEGCREALDKARTQHRQKTAEELVLLADATVEYLGDGEEDVSLDRVREECGHDAEKEREMLKKHVKGLGKTGLDIFGRRIQGVWPEFYPFIDDRTLSVVKTLGLSDSADALRDLVDHHWGDLRIDDIEAHDEEEKKRKAFVRILERAVGAGLEGNVDSVIAQIV